MNVKFSDLLMGRCN